MTKNTVITMTVFVGVMATLCYLALLPDYWKHLFVDTWAYHNRISYFAHHGSIKGIPFEEYQPGALLFFSLLLPWVKAGITATQFTYYYIGLNIVCAFLFLIVIFRNRPRHALVFPLLLLAGGPIILFRFELIMGLVVALALVMIDKRKITLGMFLLGIATAIKVYPVLLFPLLWQRNYTRSISAFIAGIGVVVGLFLILFQSTLHEVISQLLIHGIKPINVESTIAIGLQISHWIINHRYYPIDLRIVFGLVPEQLPVMEKIAHGVWIIPYGMWLVWNRVKPHMRVVETSYATLLLVLFFSTQLAPQYIYWFILITP